MEVFKELAFPMAEEKWSLPLGDNYLLSKTNTIQAQSLHTIVTRERVTYGIPIDSMRRPVDAFVGPRSMKITWSSFRLINS